MLKFTASLFQSIRTHGEASFPNECCGVLLGTLNGEERVVRSLFPIENQFEAAERFHRFLITPEDYRRAETAARKEKFDIVGFYHSHPDSPSIASKYDLDHAFPWFSYLIVSIMDRRYVDHHSWIMDNDRSKFTEEAVVIE